MSFKLFITFVCICILFLSFHKVLADTPLQGSKLTQVKSNNLFNRIGLCESGGNPHAKNKYSSASGTYQFINATWYKYGKELWGDEFYSKNIWSNDNVELAWYVYQKYGTSDWNASKDCWLGVDT